MESWIFTYNQSKKQQTRPNTGVAQSDSEMGISNDYILM